MLYNVIDVNCVKAREPKSNRVKACGLKNEGYIESLLTSLLLNIHLNNEATHIDVIHTVDHLHA